MTINALQAAWRTPFKNAQMNATATNATATNATQTPIPLPSPDSQHPRTS